MFYCVLILQPLNLIGYQVEVSKTGQFSPGKTEIPFEIPLRTKGGKELYETYHGVFINIQVIFVFR